MSGKRFLKIQLMLESVNPELGKRTWKPSIALATIHVLRRRNCSRSAGPICWTVMHPSWDSNLLLAKPLMSFVRQSHRARVRSTAVHEQICGRNDKNRQNNGGHQPSDNGTRQRRIGFAASFYLERHRQQANDSGQGGHENGPKTNAAGL